MCIKYDLREVGNLETPRYNYLNLFNLLHVCSLIKIQIRWLIRAFSMQPRLSLVSSKFFLELELCQATLVC